MYIETSLEDFFEIDGIEKQDYKEIKKNDSIIQSIKFRFENKEDLEEFADLLNIPKNHIKEISEYDFTVHKKSDLGDFYE